MSTTASPTDQKLTFNRDQDLTIVVTLPAGDYLTGGASAWTLLFEITHQQTGAVVISKTSGGGGIVVTTAGSAAAAAVFTITIADTDIDDIDILPYRWRFKRNDAGYEVDIATGTINIPL